uniref:Fibronectin type-III domain-containing protein n=1 Tax=Amphimedon queenslandica TaxID=400682 RepID=A0A1X7TIZ3_AMPQE
MTMYNESSATIPSLIAGTNYSFIIIPIDTIGREGPPSSLIQYIWNVPAQVVNISWDQISSDSMTIWWNINEDTTSHYPPVHYIVSVHNITINTTDTNVTINGLYPNNEYTVYIKPVNAIGEGPLINITVNITERKTTSTNVDLHDVSVTEERSSDAITTSGNNRLMTTSVSLTIFVSVTSSSVEPSTTPSSSGSMNSSLLFSIFGSIGAILITCIIAIIVILVCIMYKRKHKSKYEYIVHISCIINIL